MDVDCWHCFQTLKTHFVRGNKLCCNKLEKETNEPMEYKATQDILDDEDVYCGLIHGHGKEGKDFALLPINESMELDYNGVKYRITKKSSNTTTTEALTPTLTEKITKSKCGLNKTEFL